MSGTVFCLCHGCVGWRKVNHLGVDEHVYWLGGAHDPLVGFFFACSSYTVPFYLASIAAASAAVLTYVFFSSYDLSPASERKRSTLAVR